jgi:hypothetical protein
VWTQLHKNILVGSNNNKGIQAHGYDNNIKPGFIKERILLKISAVQSSHGI